MYVSLMLELTLGGLLPSVTVVMCNVLQSLPHRLCLEADCVSPCAFAILLVQAAGCLTRRTPCSNATICGACEHQRVYTSGTYYP